MAMTYHSVAGQLAVVACDECGAAVPTDERDRALHETWHRERNEAVVDLTREALSQQLA